VSEGQWTELVSQGLMVEEREQLVRVEDSLRTSINCKSREYKKSMSMSMSL
jgi:hypothetical protein